MTEFFCANGKKRTVTEMYEELVAKLRDHNACISIKTLDDAADAIEELANKLCDWCGVCPKERRRPWDCEIMWPNAPIPEVYIEPPKEET